MESLIVRGGVALLVSSAIAARAYKRKSLDFSGAATGFLVIFIHLLVNYRFGAVILMFFYSSTKLTRVGEKKKMEIDGEYKKGGQRNWVQVLANSVIATALVVATGFLTDWKDICLDTGTSTLPTLLICGIIGHYACCNGDTWSSELGILSKDKPRLITSFKVVPKGTNGAVTKDGLLAATAGGAVIGATFILLGFLTTNCTMELALKQLLILPISALAGLFGSLMDSLIGATLQFSGFCEVRKTVVGKRGPTVKKICGVHILDNNAVNFVSILITTLATSAACSIVL